MRTPRLGPGQVCIGIALMVPPPLDGRLRQLRRACGDPDADAAPPHITVIPPAPVGRTALPGILRHVQTEAARFRRFQVRLHGAGSFCPVSPVVFAKVAEGFKDCQALEARLRPALEGLEACFPYHPHVTVAQDTPQAQLDQAAEALDGFDEWFSVEELEVSQLEPDAVWRPLRRFPLAAPTFGNHQVGCI
ncbi:MAG: 2'-5' RNA ligase family protein [Bifidobacteriaceae bacterium]|jgi:2'-5' RNA ligase|nr:2'-5' RNA ligase family protein [Bifidobacteriaceae bacterium]